MTLTANVNAEGCVLGSMIMDRGCVQLVRKILPDEFYFSKPEYQILYRCLCEMEDEVDGWDLVLMRDVLRSKGMLDALGGMEALIPLVETLPTAANAKYYAQCVLAAYRRRKVAEHGLNLKRSACEPGDFQSALQDVLRDTHDLTSEIGHSDRDGAKAVGELIQDSINERRKIYKLPWANTSRLTNALQPGTVTILCGNPGASKSFAALEVLAGIQHSSYYALEDSQAFHLTRMLAQKTGLPGLTDPDWILQNPSIAEAAHAENAEWLRRMGRELDADGGGQVVYSRLLGWATRKARAGSKVLIIDPVTAVQHQTRQTWTEDNDFMQRLKRIGNDHGAAVLLVTHPAKLMITPGMEGLAGGAAFSRFAQTILWLEAHDWKTSMVRYCTGTMKTPHNRTIHILKARLGKGNAKRIAATFNDSLMLLEHAPIVKKKEQDDE